MTRSRRPAGPSSGGAGVALVLVLALVALAVPVAVILAPGAPGAGPTPTTGGVLGASSTTASSSVATADPAATAPDPSTAPVATSAPAATSSPSPSADTAAEPSPAPARPSTPPKSPAIPASAIVPGSVGRSSLNLTATYSAAITINFRNRAIGVDSTAQITNTSGSGIDRVELNTIAARLGGMDLRTVAVEGRTVRATVDDQTIVVPLGGVLPAGATVPVRVAYRATLRSSTSGTQWLFAKANNVANVYRWLPWVSRRTPFDRPHHGDPFVTPVSPHVRVRIDSDRAMVYATTGDRVAVSGLSQTFEARDVRDFTITGSPSYRTTSATVGGTTIRVYYLAGGPGAAMLRAARNALTKMEPLVGDYPYKTYKVATSAGGYGMESPGLTWIPPSTTSGNLSFLVHHETAHQWFYGIVGNDQAREPYQDEAATDFLARYVLGNRRASRCAVQRLDLSIYRYSASCYFEVIYIQGGNLLDDTRRRMGNTAFWRAMREYVAENRYAIVPTKTILETLDEHTSLDLSKRFAPRFPRLY